jgi:hypothetical protein
VELYLYLPIYFHGMDRENSAFVSIYAVYDSVHKSALNWFYEHPFHKACAAKVKVSLCTPWRYTRER